MWFGNKEYSGRVRDISQQGASIVLNQTDKIGVDDRILLSFETEFNYALGGQVRWHKKSGMGLQFENTLTLEAVAKITQALAKP